MESLLNEMASYNDLARLPDPPYRSLQATSYNRAFIRRGRQGWFADSDGTGFIRTETHGTSTEWVIMEHNGPGALTRFWTPFFYYDFNQRTGPNVRIYLDGGREPVIDTPLIHLVTGRSFLSQPFSLFTARAGVAYFPIPFARRCRITLDRKPFYFSVSYRAYPPGTEVRTFTMQEYARTAQARAETARELIQPAAAAGDLLRASGVLARKTGDVQLGKMAVF